MCPRRPSGKPRLPFQVTRHGAPIQEVSLRYAINPRIGYGIKYLEWEACVDCGLDLHRWWEGGYPDDFKVHVIAFHNLRGLVRAHIEDAKAADIARKTRR